MCSNVPFRKIVPQWLWNLDLQICCASAISIGDNLVIFGGICDGQVQNDVYLIKFFTASQQKAFTSSMGFLTHLMDEAQIFFGALQEEVDPNSEQTAFQKTTNIFLEGVCQLLEEWKHQCLPKLKELYHNLNFPDFSLYASIDSYLMNIPYEISDTIKECGFVNILETFLQLVEADSDCNMLSDQFILACMPKVQMLKNVLLFPLAKDYSDKAMHIFFEEPKNEKVEEAPSTRRVKFQSTVAVRDFVTSSPGPFRPVSSPLMKSSCNYFVPRFSMSTRLTQLNPPHRICYSIIAIGENIFIFGGMLTSRINCSQLCEMHAVSGCTANLNWMASYNESADRSSKNNTVGNIWPPQLTDELWMLDVKAKMWARLAATDPRRPTKRIGHSMTAIQDLAQKSGFYIYGGIDHLDNILSGIFFFNTSTFSWRRKNASGITQTKNTTSGARHAYHSACYYQGNLIVFGGYKDHLMSNDSFIISLDTGRCKQLNPSGTRPCPRVKHSAYIADTTMYVFGGYSEKSDINIGEIYLYSVTSNAWTFASLSGILKSDCLHASHILHKNRIQMFGGHLNQKQCMLHSAALHPVKQNGVKSTSPIATFEELVI